MNENLNLVEILKNCPEGTKLYSTIYGDVELIRVNQNDDVDYPIKIKINEIYHDDLTLDGRLFADYGGECVLFPSREQRDWSKFRIKNPKFDPKTFQPFDKVLIKRGDESYYLWFPDFISLPPNDDDETILCMNTDDVVMVIPYNEETKHLVDTNDEAPKFYRYWEDINYDD